MTDTLSLILAQPAETPLRELLHATDCYTLFDELEDAGHRAEWQQVLLWHRQGACGDVAGWVVARGMSPGDYPVEAA